LCFTHGEASTIGASEGLGELRKRELTAAAEVLGVAEVTLLDLPDGGLDAVPDAELEASGSRSTSPRSSCSNRRGSPGSLTIRR
jgi:LmbE family N-acetylglucosaminyl deacetylase